MNVRIEDARVVLSAQGGELIKLKSALLGALGNALSVRGNELSFPRACEDIAFTSVPSLEKALGGEISVFSKHAKAREASEISFKNGDISLVPEFWRKILDEPQLRAVNRMVFPNLLGLCLFDEQGSGKTVMTIAAFDVLKERGLVDAAFVVCPKSMLYGWKGDFEKFLPGKYDVRILDGLPEQRRTCVSGKFDVLVANYEGLCDMKVRLKAIADGRKILLVVDESYYAKNTEARRSRAAVEIREHCWRCFVLCGTPAPNSPYDLINQFSLADKGFTFAAFAKSRDPERDKDRISRLVETRGVFIRRLKEEIIENVPKKNFRILSVSLSGQQLRMYEDARRNLVLVLRAFDARTFRRNLGSYFARRSALLQICSVPSAIDPAFSETPAKYVVLDELLEKLFAERRKVILWSSYIASIEELRIRYGNRKPLVINGSVSSAERERAVAVFQNDPDRLLFIANPSAAGAGITLHASHDAVYVSYTNQVAHVLQSFDRIHRRGQKSTEVNYWLLVCEGTLEEGEVRRLRERERQQQVLLGDSTPYPSSLDEALAELGEVP